MPSQKLQSLFRKFKSDNEIFHDLMPFRVREILLVATVYDAFTLEQEERLSELIFGEYHHLNLTSAPRITSVSSGLEALELLEQRRFQMVISMIRINDMTPFELSRQISEKHPHVPILLLLNDNSDLRLLDDKDDELQHFNQVFVWNGDPKVFLAMIKFVEDQQNVKNDTHIGMVRVILLVEDSIRYYSRYLPILYSEIMEQTQALIAEEKMDETKKVLRMRARPKVLLATRYEKAVELINEYKSSLLCVISDVKYPKEGIKEETAGLQLIRYVKDRILDLPTLLQSSDQHNAALAQELESAFLNKNRIDLGKALSKFIKENLGFGDFVFRNDNEKEIGRAHTIKEFIHQIQHIPYDSLLYHARHNNFSTWLMARGEIQSAKRLRPIKVSDFPDEKHLLEYLIQAFEHLEKQQILGKVVAFEPSFLERTGHILRLATGSLGGKGRGLAFSNRMLSSYNLQEIAPDVEVRIPHTAIIGTDAFEQFIELNQLAQFIFECEDFSLLQERFLDAKLPEDLCRKISQYLDVIQTPIAVRSSGLFEDSLSQPFAGIYDTFLLPNNHPDAQVRHQHLCQAIKLVFASVFSDTAKAYFNTIHYKCEEEKMAVVIQEVAGKQYDHYFYPHISGVAQSVNSYPFSYVEPHDGIAFAAVGLGKYVVDGEKAYRFCPRYPKLEFLGSEDRFRNSQKYFYALDLSLSDVSLRQGEDSTLQKLELMQAEPHGTLQHAVSTWDIINNRLEPGLRERGPKIVNFANVLKYNVFPLGAIIDFLLDVMENAMGTAVEIEYAVNLEKNAKGKATFYLLQVKPLITTLEEYSLDISSIHKDDLVLYTEKGMGNGQIEDVYDIIFIDESKFNSAETFEMAAEIEALNKQMKAEEKPYIVIGPGRWGSRDHWLGIPVKWHQISNAKVIVETGLKNFQVDASLGSHFFHHIISMNIGYFTIPYHSPTDFIRWEKLYQMPVQNRTKHFIHVRSEAPFPIQMDGQKSIGIIELPTEIPVEIPRNEP